MQTWGSVYGRAVFVNEQGQYAYVDTGELVEVNKQKGETTMNEAIIKMYPKTEDAVLVEKYFGESFKDHELFGILVKGREQEILDEAKRMRDEEDK